MKSLPNGCRSFTFSIPMQVRGPRKLILATRKTQPAVRETLSYQKRFAALLERLGEVVSSGD